MAWLRRLYAGLHLRVNNEKSAVDRAVTRKILGFSMWVGPKGKVCLRVAEKALDKMKNRVREITSRNGGKSIAKVAENLRSYLTGWRNYFKLADTPRRFSDTDEWIRHRMRMLHLKHWRKGRTVFVELIKRGCLNDRAAQIAANAKRWWKNSAMSLNNVLPNSYFDQLGIPRLGR